MKKRAAGLLTMMLLSGAAVPSLSAEATTSVQVKEAGKVFEAAKDVALDKVWTVSFNKAVAADAVLEDFVSVTDQNGVKQDVEITLSEDKKSIKVAPTTKYDQDTTYTLVIQSGLPAKGGKTLKTKVEKSFTTLKLVKFLSYEKSYEVENTTDAVQTVKWDTEAEAVVTADGVLKDYKRKVKSLKLQAGEKAIISFEKDPSVPTGLAAKETDQQAYTVVQLEREGSINLTHSNEKNIHFALVNQGKPKMRVSRAQYRKDVGDAYSIGQFEYDTSEYFTNDTDTVLTNDGQAAVKVYIPKVGSTVAASDEAALTTYALKPGISFNVQSAIQGDNTKAMPFFVYHSAGKGNYNLTTYKADGRFLNMSEKKATSTTYSSSTQSVSANSEAIVESEATNTEDMQLLVPTRTAKVKETDEKAVIRKTLAPNDTVAVTAQDNKAVGFEPIVNVHIKGEKGQLFDAVTYNESGRMLEFFHRLIPYTNDPIDLDSYSQDKVVIQNKSDKDFEIYVPGREGYGNIDTTYVQKNHNAKFVKDEYKYEAFNKYELNPGEQVQVTSEEIGAALGTEFYVEDPTLTGSFTSLVYTGGQIYEANDYVFNEKAVNNTYWQKDMIKTFTWSTKGFMANGAATVITNTGDTVLTVCGPENVKYEKIEPPKDEDKEEQ